MILELFLQFWMLMATTGSGDSSSVDPPRWLPAAHADSAALTPAHSARGSQPAQLSSAPVVAACHGGGATRLFHPWMPRDAAHYGVQFGIREPMVVWSPYSAQLYMQPPAPSAFAPNFPGMSAPPPLPPPLRPCPPPVPQHSPPVSQWSAGPSTISAKSVRVPAEHTGSWLDTRLVPIDHWDVGVNCGERATVAPSVVIPARCAPTELVNSTLAPSASSAVRRGMGTCAEDEGGPRNPQEGANDADLSTRCTSTWEAVAERMSAPPAQGMTQGVAEGGLLGEGDDISAWLSRLVGGTAGPSLPDAPMAELTQLQGNEATRGHVMMMPGRVASCGSSGTAASAGRGTTYNVLFNNPVHAVPAPAPASTSAHGPPAARRHPAPAPPPPLAHAPSSLLAVQAGRMGVTAGSTVAGGGGMEQWGGGEQRGEWGRRGMGGEESYEEGGVEEEACMEGMTVEQILQERRKRRMVSNRLSAKRSRQRRQQLLSHLESDADERLLEDELEAQLASQRATLAEVDALLQAEPSPEIAEVRGELSEAVAASEASLLQLKRQRLMRHADRLAEGLSAEAAARGGTGEARGAGTASAEQTDIGGTSGGERRAEDGGGEEPKKGDGEEGKGGKGGEWGVSVEQRCLFRHVDGRWYAGEVLALEGGGDDGGDGDSGVEKVAGNRGGECGGDIGRAEGEERGSEGVGAGEGGADGEEGGEERVGLGYVSGAGEEGQGKQAEWEGRGEEGREREGRRKRGRSRRGGRRLARVGFLYPTTRAHQVRAHTRHHGSFKNHASSIPTSFFSAPHSPPRLSPPRTRPSCQLCRFFLSRTCHFHHRCRNSHGRLLPLASLRALPLPPCPLSLPPGSSLLAAAPPAPLAHALTRLWEQAELQSHHATCPGASSSSAAARASAAVHLPTCACTCTVTLVRDGSSSSLPLSCLVPLSFLHSLPHAAETATPLVPGSAEERAIGLRGSASESSSSSSSSSSEESGEGYESDDKNDGAAGGGGDPPSSMSPFAAAASLAAALQHAHAAAAAGPQSETVAFAAWEQHTRGVASRLMARMGFQRGAGLGRDGGGITSPVGVRPGKERRGAKGGGVGGAGLGVEEEEGKGGARDGSAGGGEEGGKKRKKSRGGERARNRKKIAAEREAAAAAAEEEGGRRGDVFDFINVHLGGREKEAGDEARIVHRGGNGRRESGSESAGGGGSQSERMGGGREEERRELMQQEERVREVRARVGRYEEMAGRHAHDKVTLAAVHRKLAAAREELRRVQGGRDSAHSSAAQKEALRKWTKF
ncbi:unnamed protein product [Closterium sp. Naga37s-1]|nr:unnamed protein product [Closterium sp. Naga37s-1]